MSNLSNKDTEYIRMRILDVADPNSGYTQEDFDKEFSRDSFFAEETDTKIKINFVNKSTNQDPEYATSGSSGFDLRANLDEPMTLNPHGGFAMVPTGLFFEIPDNFEIQVRPRSGLAAKNQVTVLNSPGTVDSDYRGEIKVILINHGSSEFVVNHGDRIAQAVVSFVYAKNNITLNKIKEINNDTERGDGGFGSTGKN
jgi:dUTP pyrophosphatase